MAISATPIIPRDGALLVNDLTPSTPLALVILYLGGDLKITGLNAAQKTRTVFKSKGTVYSARDVDDQEYGIEFTADAVHFEGDGTTGTPFEAFMKLGTIWSAAISTLPTVAGDTYCVKLTWTIERTNFGAAADNIVVAKYV